MNWNNNGSYRQFSNTLLHSTFPMYLIRIIATVAVTTPTAKQLSFLLLVRRSSRILWIRKQTAHPKYITTLMMPNFVIAQFVNPLRKLSWHVKCSQFDNSLNLPVHILLFSVTCPKKCQLNEKEEWIKTNLASAMQELIQVMWTSMTIWWISRTLARSKRMWNACFVDSAHCSIFYCCYYRCRHLLSSNFITSHDKYSITSHSFL